MGRSITAFIRRIHPSWIDWRNNLTNRLARGVRCIGTAIFEKGDCWACGRIIIFKIFLAKKAMFYLFFIFLHHYSTPMPFILWMVGQGWGIHIYGKTFTWRFVLGTLKLRNFLTLPGKATVDVCGICLYSFLHAFTRSMGDELYISAWASALLFWQGGQCEGLKVRDGQQVQIPALFFIYCSCLYNFRFGESAESFIKLCHKIRP